MYSLKRYVGALFLIFFSFSTAVWADGLSVGSWNVKRLGHGNKDYQSLALVAGLFDLIALQEVMKPEAVVNLVGVLERTTGDDWDYISSHLIGRGSYKEAYSYVFRTKKVELDGGMGRAAVYLDKDDIFAREPFSVVFKDLSTGDRFVMASVHILWGKGVTDRLPEIQFLDDYWLWLESVYEGMPIVLVGDFNLPPDHAGFDQLERLNVAPLITTGATTLSSYNGRFANLYDNIWIRSESSKRLSIRRSGIFNFPAFLGISHDEARDVVSDHAPVFFQTHSANLTPPK